MGEKLGQTGGVSVVAQVVQKESRFVGDFTSLKASRLTEPADQRMEILDGDFLFCFVLISGTCVSA